ncbi:MAG: hypothetical protein Tsb0020_02550 [Haliangiales bacterium]
MNLDKSGKIFFGCKIDSKIRDAMHHAKPGARRYFEGTEFLQVCEVGDDEKWIGKVVDGGLNAVAVEDIQRNVVSILRRISADLRVTPSAVKVFVVEGEQVIGRGGRDDDGGARESRGPYIANY